jgi:ribose transport system permease protein
VNAPAEPATGRSLRARRFGSLLLAAPIFGLLAILIVLIILKQPTFTEPEVFLAFLKRAAPLMILAAGQLFVIASGEFDLSVGSMMTVLVVVAARLIDNDPAEVWPVIGLLFVMAAVLGVVNGVITTKLLVPSFITTLAMLLILDGAVWLWTDGSPRGGLPDEFRNLGRTGIEDVPVLGQLPWSVLILIAFGGITWWLLHRSRYGRQVLAVGGNVRAAELSGVPVDRVKILAFVISAISAAVAGILLGGFGGVSANTGEGYEFQAIVAVVLGGAALGGGTGSVPAAMAGALTLEALFTLLNLHGVSGALEDTVQGVIVILALSVPAARLFLSRLSNRRGRDPAPAA